MSSARILPPDGDLVEQLPTLDSVQPCTMDPAPSAMHHGANAPAGEVTMECNRDVSCSPQRDETLRVRGRLSEDAGPTSPAAAGSPSFMKDRGKSRSMKMIRAMSMGRLSDGAHPASPTEGCSQSFKRREQSRSMKMITALSNPRPRSKKKLGEDEAQICLKGTEPAVFMVRVDTSGQHTIHWSDNIVEVDTDVDVIKYSTQWLKRARRHQVQPTIADAPSGVTSQEVQNTLPAGSCNLYNFPIIKTSTDPKGRHPTATELRILHRIMIALYMQSGCLDRPDEVGAYPVHALAVSNVPESIALVVELHRQRPDLMTLMHVGHRSGVPVFVGETTLHIFAVNEREAEFIQMVRLAMSSLSVPDARALFCSPAEGAFFMSLPMLFFGGTPLSYAVAFQLDDAVRALLDTGLIDINDRTTACPLTGFMPLHVAVASGSCTMYDVLTTQLPPKQRADEGMLTLRGKVRMWPQIGAICHGCLLAAWTHPPGSPPLGTAFLTPPGPCLVCFVHSAPSIVAFRASSLPQPLATTRYCSTCSRGNARSAGFGGLSSSIRSTSRASTRPGVAAATSWSSSCAPVPTRRPLPCSLTLS